MNLRAAIEKVKTEYVYIGSGCGYLWIGKKEEALEAMGRMQAEYYLNLCELKSKNFKKVVAYKKSIKSLLDSIKAENDAEQVRRAFETLGVKKEYFKIAKSAYEARRKELKNFSNFLERETKNMYLIRSFAPGGTAIIFEGIECGKYWTYDEMNDGDKEIR